ncbi:MAG: hypothetical protein ACE5JO_04200 [Candidatus Binatia bacterium]
MKNTGIIIASLLGLTSLQVVWRWLQEDRQFTRLSLAVWLLFLALLAAYYLLLCSKTISRPLKKLHLWAYAQLRGPRVLGLGLVFLGTYTIWYTYHVWGGLLIRKDLGSFFYRYALLDQIFPRLVAYNPMLNGGYETIELLMTGSINLFLLTYPIGSLFSVETALKAQPLLLILLLPVLIYLSARLIGFSHAESLLSAAFALVMTPSGHAGLLEKLIHGTLPYVFSSELAVVVFALSYRLFISGKSAAWGIPLIILLGSLGSLHPVFLLIIGPVALAIVFFGEIPRKQKITYCALIGLGLLAINGSWITELLTYTKGGIITNNIDPSGLSLTSWIKKLERNFLGLPVPLVIGSMVGVGHLLRASREVEKRRLGGLLLFAILYCALLSSIGYFVVAPLQPERFVLPLSLFLSMALGASWSAVHSLWTRIEQQGSIASNCSNTALLLLAIFLCLPYSAYFFAFPTAPPTTYRLVNWLKENVGDHGRVFFYGPDRTVMGGKVSFFQAKTQRPIMGVLSPQVSKSYGWLVEIGECLKKTENASGCKNLYNIRYAITFLGNRQAEGVPSPKEGELDDFNLVKTIGRMQIYESRRPSSYFLIGQGKIKPYLNRIAVAAEPSRFVVLKFFWVPGLRTEPPLVVEPYPLPNGKAFIKVQSNYQRTFDILYR